MNRRGKRNSNFSQSDEDLRTPKNKRSSGSTNKRSQGSQKQDKNASKNKSTAGTSRSSSQSQKSSSTGTPRSTKSQTSIADYFVEGSSQKNVIPQVELLELARSAAFYIIAVSSTKTAITRAELMKSVLVNYNARVFPKLIEKTTEIIQEVFGLKLVSADDKEMLRSDKFLMMNNLGSPKCVIEPDNSDKNAHQVLLCLILNCILMSGGCITEVDMLDFLVELKIQPKETNSEAFGNIAAKLAAYKTQQYLKYDVDKTLEPPAIVVKWGPRAWVETNRKTMLHFVQQVYPDLLASDILNMDLSESEEEAQEEEEEEEEEESEVETD